MKKQRFKNLSLHKESISKLQSLVKGGRQDTIRCVPSIIIDGVNLCHTRFNATCPEAWCVTNELDTLTEPIC